MSIELYFETLENTGEELRYLGLGKVSLAPGKYTVRVSKGTGDGIQLKLIDRSKGKLVYPEKFYPTGD